MSNENELVSNSESGVYVLPREDFVSYWHGLNTTQREQYVAIYADLILSNKEIRELLPEFNFSRDQLIEMLRSNSEIILTLKP